MKPRKNIPWRAATFIGAHILAVLSVYVLGVAPLVDLLNAQREDIDGKAQFLSRSHETLIRLEAQVRASPPLDDSRFLVGSNGGVADALLQTRLKALIETQGAMIVSQRSLDSRALGRLTMRGARIDLVGTIASLANAVRGIETSEAPALFITGATVRMSSSGAAAGDKAEPPLEAQIDVEAPFLAESSSP